MERNWEACLQNSSWRIALKLDFAVKTCLRAQQYGRYRQTSECRFRCCARYRVAQASSSSMISGYRLSPSHPGLSASIRILHLPKLRTYQSMPIKLHDGISSIPYILKFHKTHRPIDLLPKAHPLESGTSLEQRSKRFLEKVGRMRRRGNGREVADIQCIYLMKR